MQLVFVQLVWFVVVALVFVQLVWFVVVVRGAMHTTRLDRASQMAT